MIAETFVPGDYETICSFWNKRRRIKLPLSFLPPTGVVIRDDGVAIAFGFLVKTDTPFATICDLVTNPEASSEQRDEALHILIRELENKAREAKYSAVCASTNHRGLCNRYDKMGFNRVDDDLLLFSRFLCQQVD